MSLFWLLGFFVLFHFHGHWDESQRFRLPAALPKSLLHVANKTLPFLQLRLPIQGWVFKPIPFMEVLEMLSCKVVYRMQSWSKPDHVRDVFLWQGDELETYQGLHSKGRHIKDSAPYAILALTTLRTLWTVCVCVCSYKYITRQASTQDSLGLTPVIIIISLSGNNNRRSAVLVIPIFQLGSWEENSQFMSHQLH